MAKRQFKEICCFLVLIAFIFVISSEPSNSNKSTDEVAQNILKVMNTSDITKRSNTDFKKQFGFNVSEFDSVTYYASDSVMQVNELLVVRLKDNSQAQALTDAIEKRMEEKISAFEGYAPNEAALLKAHETKHNRNFIMFAVDENIQAAVGAFKKAL